MRRAIEDSACPKRKHAGFPLTIHRKSKLALLLVFAPVHGRRAAGGREPMPNRFHRSGKIAQAPYLHSVCLIFVASLSLMPALINAQTNAPNVARLDRLAAHARTLESAPGFDRARLYGSA